MKTREEALKFGLSFKNVYEEKPFHDPNWQLIRVKGSKKAFLWIYERNGYINLNVKTCLLYTSYQPEVSQSQQIQEQKNCQNQLLLPSAMDDLLFF